MSIVRGGRVAGDGAVRQSQLAAAGDSSYATVGRTSRVIADRAVNDRQQKTVTDAAAAAAVALVICAAAGLITANVLSVTVKVPKFAIPPP